MTSEKYRIGKTYISATNPEDAKKRIEEAALNGKGGYVCVSNMRTVVYGNKRANYAALMNNAFMCFPDGMPLVWMARLWGRKDVHRTTGPDLMVKMLKNADNGLRHFLLGDTDETLSELKNKYPEALISGTYSPPFCEVDEFDYAGIAEKIKESGANIVWVSMRAPKQDFFSARIVELLPDKIFIGVGAAFRFAIGEIKHPPKLVQKLGLTGFFWRKNKIQTLWSNMGRVIYLCKFGIQIVFSRLFHR